MRMRLAPLLGRGRGPRPRRLSSGFRRASRDPQEHRATNERPESPACTPKLSEFPTGAIGLSMCSRSPSGATSFLRVAVAQGSSVTLAALQAPRGPSALHRFVRGDRPSQTWGTWRPRGRNTWRPRSTRWLPCRSGKPLATSSPSGFRPFRAPRCPSGWPTLPRQGSSAGRAGNTSGTPSTTSWSTP